MNKWKKEIDVKNEQIDGYILDIENAKRMVNSIRMLQNESIKTFEMVSDEAWNKLKKDKKKFIIYSLVYILIACSIITGTVLISAPSFVIVFVSFLASYGCSYLLNTKGMKTCSESINKLNFLKKSFGFSDEKHRQDFLLEQEEIISEYELEISMILKSVENLYARIYKVKKEIYDLEQIDDYVSNNKEINIAVVKKLLRKDNKKCF